MMVAATWTFGSAPSIYSSLSLFGWTPANLMALWAKFPPARPKLAPRQHQPQLTR
jgi:hypothetical protein